jgi:polysaccharide pyruvyl transferase WcaK-like protein
MPKLLVLNDTRDQPNWGSQACAEALVEILVDRVHGAEIETYTSQWMLQRYRIRRRSGGEPYRRSKPGRLERRRTMPCAIGPHVVDEFEFVAERWLSGAAGPGAREYVEDLQRVDAVVFNAEGSTYRANHVAQLAMFMLWLARTQFDLPAFFLNGIVALTDVDATLPGMARRTFPLLDGITVREPLSERNVARYVPEASAELVPDSVFAYGPELVDQAGPAVRALQDRLVGPYFVLSSSMLPVDFSRTLGQSSLVHLIRELKKLVPNAVLTAKDKGDQWLQSVATMTDSQFFGADQSYADLAALLESAAFLVSGRYHNIILASIVGCPAVALTSTSPKVAGLCELMEGLIGQPFDVTDLWGNAGRIIDAANEHLRHRDARRGELLELTTRHRAATGRMGDIVQARFSADSPSDRSGRATPPPTSHE